MKDTTIDEKDNSNKMRFSPTRPIVGIKKEDSVSLDYNEILRLELIFKEIKVLNEENEYLLEELTEQLKEYELLKVEYEKLYDKYFNLKESLKEK